MTKPPVKKPKNPEAPTRYLYVANCSVGGEHGIGELPILSVFGKFGAIDDLYSEDERGYVLITYKDVESAVLAREALNGSSTEELGNRKLFIQFSDKDTTTESSTSMSCTSTTAQIVIPGLSIFEGFLSSEEEESLMNTIDSNEWEESIQRRVQHYGYAFRYDTRDVDVHASLGPMPNFCLEMLSKMEKIRPDIECPDQITINEYNPGQGIAPHVDTPGVFTEYIASISLGSDIVMDFRLVSNPSIVKHVHLKRGSLCLMVGEARYLWKHGIAYRKHDLVDGCVQLRDRRLSLTLRKIILEPTNHETAIDHSVQRPTDIEKEHVHGVYDSIASHFSHTRHHPWPLVSTFLESLASGSLVADIGCGNGKYLGVNKECMMIGSDRSIPLLSVCSERLHEVFGCDGLAVPLRTGAFDAAICIAVLHHMSTIEHRLQILRELARIVKVGGQVYVVAWAFEQDGLSKRKFETQDVMVEWKLQQKYIDRNEPLPSHVQLDDEKKWAVYQRYCHVYKDSELEQLVHQVPGLQVLKVESMRSNWCLTIQRVFSTHPTTMSTFDDIFGDTSDFMGSNAPSTLPVDAAGGTSSSISLEGLGLDDFDLGSKSNVTQNAPTAPITSSDQSDFLDWLDQKPSTSTTSSSAEVTKPSPPTTISMDDMFSFDEPAGDVKISPPPSNPIPTTVLPPVSIETAAPVTPVPAIVLKADSNEFASPPPMPVPVKQVSPPQSNLESNSSETSLPHSNSKGSNPFADNPIPHQSAQHLSNITSTPPHSTSKNPTPQHSNKGVSLGDTAQNCQSNLVVETSNEIKGGSRQSSFDAFTNSPVIIANEHSTAERASENDTLRSKYRQSNKISSSERLLAWGKLLEAKLHDPLQVSISQPSTEELKKDAESICSVLFGDTAFCNVLKQEGVPVDAARLSMTDNVEQLFRAYCSYHHIQYFPKLATTFAPLLALTSDPLRPDIFGLLDVVSTRLIPAQMVHIPLHSVASARRPLMKLLLLYHDPTVSLHLDHTLPQWNEETTGILPDSWLASLFEGTDHTNTMPLDALNNIWDCYIVNASSTYPSIIGLFIVLHAILHSKKRLLSLTNSTSLRTVMMQLLVETLSQSPQLLQNVHDLIEKTPFSFCTRLCDAGMEVPTTEKSSSRSNSSSNMLVSPRTGSKEQLETPASTSTAPSTSKFGVSFSSMNSKFFAGASKLTASITGKSEADKPASRSESFHLETSAVYFSMAISACEVIPSVFRGFKTSCTEKIRYFIVDCRPEEFLNRGRIPTSFAFNAESLLDPSAFDAVMATLQPMKASVHICILGHGYARHANHMVKDLNIPKSLVADMLAKDAAQINDAVMFLAKRGFPYISVVEGGFASAHRFLTKSRLFTLSDLTDHDTKKCDLCLQDSALKSKGRNASSHSDEEDEYIQRTEGGVCLGRYGPDGRKRTSIAHSRPSVTSPSTTSSYFSSMTNALKDSTKTMAAVSSKTLKAVPGSDKMTGALKESKNWMLKKSESIHLNDVSTSMTSGMRSVVDVAANPTTMFKKAANSFASTLGNAEPPMMPSAQSNVATSTQQTSTAKKPAPSQAKEAVFSIDDDDDEEADDFLGGNEPSEDHENQPVAPVLVVHVIKKGGIDDLRKGMQIRMAELLPLVSSPLFSCYKKKTRGADTLMLPRHVVIAEGHIIVLKADKIQEDVSYVRSCHHLSQISRMTCMKKNALMVTLYLSFDGKQKQKSYEVQQRDAFIKVVRASMEALAAQRDEEES